MIREYAVYLFPFLLVLLCLVLLARVIRRSAVTERKYKLLLFLVAIPLTYVPLLDLSAAEYILTLIPNYSIGSFVIVMTPLWAMFFNRPLLSNRHLTQFCSWNIFISLALYASSMAFIKPDLYYMGYGFSYFFIIMAVLTIILLMFKNPLGLIFISYIAVFDLKLLPSDNFFDHITDGLCFTFSVVIILFRTIQPLLARLRITGWDNKIRSIFAVPALIKLGLMTVLVNLCIFTIIRLVFHFVFYDPQHPIAFAIIAKSLYIGGKFDLRLALLLSLPLFALAWIKPVHIFNTRLGQKLWTVYLAGVFIAVLIFYIFDFGHYAYLQGRLNATAFGLLYDLSTSLRMIWETYPVIWALAGLVMFGACYTYMIRRLIARYAAASAGRSSRLHTILVIVVFTLFYAGGMYGKLSYYPLRWSDVFFTTNSYTSQLALNPVLYFFDTFKNRAGKYDRKSVAKYYPLMSEYLGVPKPDMNKLDFTRAVTPRQKNTKKMNVVIVLLESMAAHKTGMFGNPLNPTPNLDAISKQSLFFKRFYVPSPGTARSVFTLIAGMPDVETNSTSTRNPLIVKQNTVINSFANHEKFYFIGGSSTWANIKGLLSHNIPDLHLYEEGSYSSKRIDVWGISDLSLFKEANAVLKNTQKPFIAIIQTSGSHRPYTIPDENDGFVHKAVDENDAKRYGFVSSAEFNSFRFIDHSIGEFIRIAQKEPYFNNTVFVFLGDHGLPGNAPHMQKAEEVLNLVSVHVPLLIYAPGMIDKGKEYDILAGEYDVLPTVASFTNTPYLTSSLGRNVLDPRFDGKRYAFTISDQGNNPQIGVVSDAYYFVMNVDGSNKRLYGYYSKTPNENLLTANPEIAAEMERICRAIYETARYIRYHNSSSPQTGTLIK